MPESISRGTHSLSERGCLLIEPLPRFEKKFPRALRGYPGNVPLWPSFFGLDTGGGEVRVLDGDGRVVAWVGERVSMGGGEIGNETIRANDLMGERELGELSERCPEYYWFVGEGTHIPGRRDWPRPSRPQKASTRPFENPTHAKFAEDPFRNSLENG